MYTSAEGQDRGQAGFTPRGQPLTNLSGGAHKGIQGAPVPSEARIQKRKQKMHTKQTNRGNEVMEIRDK